MPQLHEVARLPDPADNCAIAIRDLPAGAEITHGGARYALSHHVLEGHRFAVAPIAPGESLTSWRQRFGIASADIRPGDYVINEAVQTELSRRSLDFDLPARANFHNLIESYAFDESSFEPAPPMPLHDHMRYFEGYERKGGRGVGTRNMIVILGTSSLTAGFVRAVAGRLGAMADDYDHVDGIVPLAHTEGGHSQPNNRELLLRTLAGFMTHANVGAVLAIDYGREAITNAELRAFMLDNGYPLAHLRHTFYSLAPGFEENIEHCRAQLAEWLPQVNQVQRGPQPLSALRIALQCGGSDAFSGISGNPLAAWVAKEVIRYGGGANPGGNRRTHRLGILCAGQSRAAGDGAALFALRRALQGMGGRAWANGGRKPLGRQQISRTLQHRLEIAGRGRQAPPRCAAARCHRLQPAHDRRRLLFHGQSGQ